LKVHIKSQRDFWAGVLFASIGAGFAWGAAAYYPFGTSSRPGPGYFPLLLGAGMTLLGLLIVIESLVKRSAHDGDPIGKIAWKQLAIIVGSITLFGFLLPRVGLFIALPLLVILGSMASNEAKLPVTLANATILTLGSWAVFVLGLGLSIPLWPDFIGN
jgi:hypothetical protein